MSQVDNALKNAAGKLEMIRQQRRLPSVSAAAAYNGRIIWQEACGFTDMETKRPASPETVYPLGSITKVFSVTMLMQLVEQGIVSLEDPVAKYIPEYQVRSPFPGTLPTTLRQLAAHTSGLPRDAAINFPMNHSLGDWEFSDGQAPLQWYASAEDVLASLPTVVLELPPDTAKIYSNLGIMLLGLALERADHQDFGAYIADRIFAPLGMTSAGFLNDTVAWGGRFPLGYGFSSKNGSLFKAPSWRLGGAMYTGGIYATAADLVRFSAAFMVEPSPILTAASIQRMIHPAAMGDTHLGWWKGFHAGYANFGHAGAHVGFISAVLFVPELNLAVAVQTNRWNPIFDTNDSTEIARWLLGELIPSAELDRKPFSAEAVELECYEGVYRLPGNYASATVAISGSRDGILFVLEGVPANPMYLVPVGDHQFGLPGTQFPVVSFQADSSGDITTLSYALFNFYKE